MREKLYLVIPFLPHPKKINKYLCGEERMTSITSISALVKRTMDKMAEIETFLSDSF